MTLTRDLVRQGHVTLTYKIVGVEATYLAILPLTLLTQLTRETRKIMSLARIGPEIGKVTCKST